MLVLACAGRLQAQIAEASVEPARIPEYASVARPGPRQHPDAPEDEPQAGTTARGTPLTQRNERHFPAESRNLFHRVDMVWSDAQGALVPFDYSADEGARADAARDAIRGKNTWILWGAGTEEFWGWFQEEGYGLGDLLVLLDSRKRSQRFRTAGIMNQPGMRAVTEPNRLGLYLDEAEPGVGDEPSKIFLTEPSGKVSQPYPLEVPFEPVESDEYRKILEDLPQDGVDPRVYGYPSGVVSLRLWPNPDFFAKTPAAKRARAYWDERVTANPQAFYNDRSVQADPNLIRPFRVSMTCAFCHIGPHPLNPPADPEAPEWENLSSTIGNQYWRPAQLFTNLLRDDSFIRQFLASSLPGTLDTSQVNTDHISNPNAINAIFDVPARLALAARNPPEEQSAANLLLPAVEEPHRTITPRRTPRVLLDGSDSIGVFGALARVYLNFGTHPRLWARSHNPIVGFRAQTPFSIETLSETSVFWRINIERRVPYMGAFFEYRNAAGKNVAPPMKLEHAAQGGTRVGKRIVASHATRAAAGRKVFLERCAICHSSIQPPNFRLDFGDDWEARNSANTASRYALTLPRAFADWERFIDSAPYRNYVARMLRDAPPPRPDQPDPFLTGNFLSTDIRVPVTLTGTNAGRAVATNAMRGQMWDNFSSETYKRLPAVGPVRFYNPYAHGTGIDQWLNNDAFLPPGGGPGYYRPPSLIGLWATAPYLHNNALGYYNGNPQIAARLAAFHDGIDKLLWSKRRAARPASATGGLEPPPGDLRFASPGFFSAGGLTDPGYIYRTTQRSRIEFAKPFIRPLIEGIAGSFWTRFATHYLWIGTALALAILAVGGRARHAGFVLLVIGVVVGAALAVLRLDRVYGSVLWLTPLAPVALASWFWLSGTGTRAARTVLAALALAALYAGAKTNAFVSGRLGDLSLGTIPKGTPVALVMNLDPDAPTGDLIRALAALLRGLLIVEHRHLDELEKLEDLYWYREIDVAQLERRELAALKAFENEAGAAMLQVSKNPDFVLDRGHWFGESLTDEQKGDLKAFLLTL